MFDAGDEALRADIQEDIEFALIQMKAETLNKINEALGRLEEARPTATASSAARRSPKRGCGALPFAVRCKDCEEAREVGGSRGGIWQQRRGGALAFMDMSS